MSRGVGQGELLEAPKPRRLIVREGETSWWGVDPSSLRVAIAAVDENCDRYVELAPFGSGSGPSRMGEIYAETWWAAGRVMNLGYVPGVIAVEQPSGQTPNPTLLYATGAIIAALAERARHERQRSCEIVMVTSSGWKALAVGHGHLYKPRPPCKPEDYAVLRWARENGYSGSSWDAADAWGVAEWARRTFDLEAR